jgi:hypothetical protein
MLRRRGRSFRPRRIGPRAFAREAGFHARQDSQGCASRANGVTGSTMSRCRDPPDSRKRRQAAALHRCGRSGSDRAGFRKPINTSGTHFECGSLFPLSGAGTNPTPESGGKPPHSIGAAVRAATERDSGSPSIRPVPISSAGACSRCPVRGPTQLPRAAASRRTPWALPFGQRPVGIPDARHCVQHPYGVRELAPAVIIRGAALRTAA